MSIDVKCPSCKKPVGAVVIDVLRFRGVTLPGAKVYATTCLIARR
jgi:hypothetical protein